VNINRIKKNIKKVEEIVENIDAQDIINRMEIDKENSIEELEQRLEELYRTQQARLEVGADDLDIREEIAEVEEEIKELQDETIEENSIKNERSSIEENIKIIEDFILKTDVDYSEYNEQIVGDISYQAIQHLLSAYQEVLKENEQLKKQVQRQINKWNKDIKSNYISKHEVKDKNMSEEEKEAIEYLKTRLYGNEGCKYIDVAQEDLRIFINLIDRLQNLMEKLQKENKQLKKITINV
jgi:hypothetical protein